MSLSSSLFSGISGLTSMSNALTVIGDNISNVNTVGFKSSNVTFQDVLSQTVSTANGSAQVGRGTTLSDISASFSQGSFESTDSSTDLAIGGDGFFILSDANSGETYYTRDGGFSFDSEGNFVSSSGLIVQGWELNEESENVGTITDITLTSFTSAPQETDLITIVTNLDSSASNNSTDLSLSWDAQSDPCISSSAYEYQTTISVYDSLGETHDITIYYDLQSDSTWEFIVCCNPDEDYRTGATTALANGESSVGLLAKGTIEFNESSGIISDLNLDLFTAGTDFDASDTANWTTQSEASDLTDGYFTVSADFLGGSSLSIGLDFGTQYSETDSSWTNGSPSTTQYAMASSTVYQDANGYGAGDLQSISVDTDGIITGTYSNGEVIPLYRVALADFQNEQGLYKVGGNLYEETRLSGTPVTGNPGQSGLGSISPNSLEQSNVDLSTELVKMITTQRGFQASSKIITITDEMMQQLINMKR